MYMHIVYTCICTCIDFTQHFYSRAHVYTWGMFVSDAHVLEHTTTHSQHTNTHTCVQQSYLNRKWPRGPKRPKHKHTLTRARTHTHTHTTQVTSRVAEADRGRKDVMDKIQAAFERVSKNQVMTAHVRYSNVLLIGHVLSETTFEYLLQLLK